MEWSDLFFMALLYSIMKSMLLISDNLTLKMPRSNKKKKAFHQVVPAPDLAITHLLNIEKFTMIARAIVSTISIFCLCFNE